jgi:hypothetical protein
MYSLDQKDSDDGPLLSAQRTFGITLSLSGNPNLLEKPRRIFLVSRSNYTPQPDTPWLRALIAAAKHSAAQGEVLVCGCERLGYDIPRHVFARDSRNGVILVKHRSETTPPLPDNSLVVAFETIARRDPLPLRDNIAAHFATEASEILQREDGTMAHIAQALRARGVQIDSSYCVIDSEPPRTRWPQTTIPPLPFSEWEFLTHFTREPDGAWPDETHEDYVRWLCTAAPTERRDDFATLRRILAQRKILGSARFIRGGTPMVCWTALPPHAVAPLRGWRKGLRRWNFTPYGIALRKKSLEQLSVSAVRYCSEAELSSATPAESAYLQIANSGAYDWTLEKEWRSNGYLDLSRFRAEDLCVFTHTQSEADSVQKEFGVTAFATG